MTKKDGRCPVSEAFAASIFRLDKTTASRPVTDLFFIFSTFHENGVLGSFMICSPSKILFG